MIRIETLTKELAEELLSQPEMARIRIELNSEAIDFLCSSKYGYAGIDAFGRVLFCGGLFLFWEERGEAWMFFNRKACRPHWREIIMLVRTFLSIGHIKRIEATVPVDFLRGHSFLTMLGFLKEAPRLAQYRQGQDYALYSFITK